jgi:hypothetical protein
MIKEFDAGVEPFVNAGVFKTWQGAKPFPLK